MGWQLEAAGPGGRLVGLTELGVDEVSWGQEWMLLSSLRQAWALFGWWHLGLGLGQSDWLPVEPSNLEAGF